MLYMIIEHFREGPVPVYRRFREKGRMAPEGLRYVNSWVTTDLNKCYQVMECENPDLIRQWIQNWEDLADFEIIPVVTSAQAAASAVAVGPADPSKQ